VIEMKKYRMETIVGVFVVTGLLCIGYIGAKLGDLSLFGEDSYSLYARFSSVSGLRVGNIVEMFGLNVGRVARLSIDQEKQAGLVEIKIRKGVTVYGDAIASIRTTGLIGDRYVKLDPGGSGDKLKPGDTIRETEPPLDIGDLIGKYAFGGVNKDTK
jgi:phospholipid/cholesterol/gamma-HCH transport system substrate-binding protein